MMSAKTFFIVVTVVAACDAFAGMQTAPLRLRGGEAWVPSAAKDSFAIPDGRRVCVLAEEKDIAGAVVECVETIGAAAIAEKGAFSLAIPGGSVVKALKGVKPTSMDFTKVHVFFCNERIGEYKCYKTAMESLKDLGIPESQIYKVGEGEPGVVAAAYEAMMCSQPESVCGKTEAGIPRVDLMLLGTGEDGHVGSIHPKSDEVKAAGTGQIVLPIDKDGKKSIAVSMDFMSSSKMVLLSAASAKRAGMVASALKGTFEADNCPAALVRAADTLWVCDTGSIAEYKQ